MYVFKLHLALFLGRGGAPTSQCRCRVLLCKHSPTAVLQLGNLHANIGQCGKTKSSASRNSCSATLPRSSTTVDSRRSSRLFRSAEYVRGLSSSEQSDRQQRASRHQRVPRLAAQIQRNSPGIDSASYICHQIATKMYKLSGMSELSN